LLENKLNDLDDELEIEIILKISEDVFNDWNNIEDSMYDNIDNKNK
jgi:hypothetical protein